LVDDWSGWRADLYYYSANVHPLHGIWACCANNRLDRSDRLMMEIAVMCFSFWMSMERYHMIHEGGTPPADWLMNDLRGNAAYSLVFVTVPGIMLYYILFFLFTTPKCGMVDESKAAKSQIAFARLVSHCGDTLGNFAVVSLIAGAIYRIVKAKAEGDSVHTDIIIGMLQGRLQGYIVAWCMMVGIYFNPFIAWGSARPGTTCLGDWIGLGQWSMEQRKVWLSTLVLPEEAADCDLLETIHLGTSAQDIGAAPQPSTVAQVLVQGVANLVTGGSSVAPVGQGIGAAELEFMKTELDDLEPARDESADLEPAKVDVIVDVGMAGVYEAVSENETKI